MTSDRTSSPPSRPTGSRPDQSRPDQSRPDGSRPDGRPAPVGRRTLVVGAGVAGAAAVAATVLHRTGVPAPQAVAAGRDAAEAGGYRLSPHVLQYYETTKA